MIELFLFEIQNIWRSYEKDIEKSDDRPVCGGDPAVIFAQTCDTAFLYEWYGGDMGVRLLRDHDDAHAVCAAAVVRRGGEASRQ